MLYITTYLTAGYAVYSPFFPLGDTPMLQRVLQCNATEASLKLCDSRFGEKSLCKSSQQAGIQCFDRDSSLPTVYLGFPTINRQFKDSGYIYAIFIVNGGAPVAGQLTGLHAYFIRPTEIYLMLWRPSLVQGHPDDYQEVWRLKVEGNTPGQHSFIPAKQEIVNVEVGDVTGIGFKVSNPVPYDLVNRCDSIRTMFTVPNQGPEFSPGKPWRFKRVDVRGTCRLYSTYIEINASGESHWNRNGFALLLLLHCRLSAEPVGDMWTKAIAMPKICQSTYYQTKHFLC